MAVMIVIGVDSMTELALGSGGSRMFAQKIPHHTRLRADHEKRQLGLPG